MACETSDPQRLTSFPDNKLEDTAMDEESDQQHTKDGENEDLQDIKIHFQVDEAAAVKATKVDECVLEDEDKMLAQARVRCCKATGDGCKMIKVPNQSPNELRRGCITQFTPGEIVAMQMSVKDMHRDAKEHLILGILNSCMRNGPKTEKKKHKVQTDRKRPRTNYSLLDRPVCKDAFLFLLQISGTFLTRLHKHYQAKGFTPPIRRAGGRKNNTRSLTLQDSDHVVHFLKDYAEIHGVKLPGRLPDFTKEAIRLLPSSCPKTHIYRLYIDHADKQGYRLISKSAFMNQWSQMCPFIIVAMTDKILKY